MGELGDDGADYVFDLVGLDGDDDHVGGVGYFRGGVYGSDAELGGVAFEFVVVGGAGDDVFAVQYAGVHHALCDGLRHVAVSDESDGVVVHGASFPASCCRKQWFVLSLPVRQRVVCLRGLEQFFQVAAVQRFRVEVFEHRAAV